MLKDTIQMPPAHEAACLFLKRHLLDFESELARARHEIASKVENESAYGFERVLRVPFHCALRAPVQVAFVDATKRATVFQETVKDALKVMFDELILGPWGTKLSVLVTSKNLTETKFDAEIHVPLF